MGFSVVSNPGYQIGNPVRVQDNKMQQPQQQIQPAPMVPAYGQPHQNVNTNMQPVQNNAAWMQNPGYGNMPQAHGAQFYNQPAYGQPSYGAVQQNAPYGMPNAAPAQASSNPQAHIPAQQMYSHNAAVQPMYNNNRGATVHNSAPSLIMKIKDITPYQNRWTIQGRCTTKSDLRRYNRNGKQGCVMNFDLMDESAEIRCVCFGDTAEKYSESIIQGKFYMLSNATAKTIDAGKRKWNTTNHSCEITVESKSKLEEVAEDDNMAAVPKMNINPVKIAEVENLPVEKFVDVVGVLDSCNDLGSITRKDGSEVKKRTMMIRDDSNKSIEVTMWGDKAEGGGGTSIYDKFRMDEHPVVLLKGVRIGEFNGKNLSTVGSSQLLLDDISIPDVQAMKQWYINGGSAQKAQSVSRSSGRSDRRVTCGILQDEMVGSGQPAWVKVLCHVISIRSHPLTYPACTLQRDGRQCNKRLQSNNDGTFYCETCAQDSTPEYRFLITFGIADFVSSRERVSAFAEGGESLLRVTATDAHERLEGEGDDNADVFDRHIQQHCLWRPRMLKVKCQEDNYTGETMIKTTLQSCEDVNWAQDSQVLLAMIDDIVNSRPIKAMQPPPPKGTPFQASTQQFGAGMPQAQYGAGAYAYGHNTGIDQTTMMGMQGQHMMQQQYAPMGYQQPSMQQMQQMQQQPVQNNGLNFI